MTTVLLAQVGEAVEGVAKSTEGRSDLTYIMVILLVCIFGSILFVVWKFAFPYLEIKRGEASDRKEEGVERNKVLKMQADGIGAIGQTLESLEGETKLCVANSETLVALQGPRRDALKKIDEAVELIDLTPEIAEIDAITSQHHRKIYRKPPGGNP